MSIVYARGWYPHHRNFLYDSLSVCLESFVDNFNTAVEADAISSVFHDGGVANDKLVANKFSHNRSEAKERRRILWPFQINVMLEPPLFLTLETLQSRDNKCLRTLHRENTCSFPDI